MSRINDTVANYSMSEIPFMVRAALGLISGVKVVHKFGLNADVDAAEDVWATGGTWVPPTQARTMSTVSGSADDDGNPVGTGALTLTIEGLDSDYNEVSETITLNGVGAVVTTQTFIRVNRAYVVTAGSGGTNAGAITITASTDGTVQATIVAGNGQTTNAIYTVPNGYTALITGFDCSNGPGSAASSLRVDLMTRAYGTGSWRVRDQNVNYEDGNTHANQEYIDIGGILVSEKDEIKLRVTPVVGNSIYAQGDFSIILFADE
jgi:hypothetical protein